MIRTTYRQRRTRVSAYQNRQRREMRQGLALITATLLGFSAFVYGAYAIDQAHGVTVSASLKAAGL